MIRGAIRKTDCSSMTKDCHPDAGAEQVRLGKKRCGADLVVNTFDVHGITTRATTNDPRAAEALATFLEPFAVAPLAEVDIDFHLFFVDDLAEEMSPVPEASLLYDWGALKVYHRHACRFLVVERGARVTADVEQCTAAGFAARNLLESDWLVTNLCFYPLWAQLLKMNGLFPLHAAGLVRDGKASLFLGRSGSGKSTLSLNLLRSGFGLLSDDTVFLREQDGEVEALSFPEEINVRKETIELLPELSRVESFNENELRRKSSFDVEELYPGCLETAAKPAVMIFPRIGNAAETEAEPMKPTEALSESLRYGFFFMDPATTGRHFQVLSQLARQASSFRLLSGSDQQELERTVRKLLDSVAADGDN